MSYGTYLFDIDFTLYTYSPAIEEWFVSFAGNFISNRLKISVTEAKAITERYYIQYGATLPGLMKHHDIDAQDFLNAEKLAPIEHLNSELPALNKIKQINSKKIAFTNASTKHAHHVLKHLDLFDSFEKIYTLETLAFIAKPAKESLDFVVQDAQIDPRSTIFFEDTPANLIYAKSLGMKTVLIGERHFLRLKKPDYVDIHVSSLTEAIEVAHGL